MNDFKQWYESQDGDVCHDYDEGHAIWQAAHAKGREEGFQVAVKALSDNMNDIIADAIEKLLEKK